LVKENESEELQKENTENNNLMQEEQQPSTESQSQVNNNSTEAIEGKLKETLNAMKAKGIIDSELRLNIEQADQSRFRE